MGARTIAWGRCTPLTIVDQFGIKISGLTPSYEALGRLLKKKKKKKKNTMMTKIRISHMSDFSCGETKVRKASWGAFFSMKGGKGGERGGKGKRVKVQIKEGNSNFIFIQK